MHANFLLFPGVTQLDLTGPYELLTRAPGLTFDFVAQDLAPIIAGPGIKFEPSVNMKEARRCDLLVVPGGPGTDAALLNTELVGFVRRQAIEAQYVFGICTGSLILGAAGVLQNRRSSCHWQAREFLRSFGASPSLERMCIDGNIFTSGGVTAGIDMALKVISLLWDEETAKQIQLQLEYDPLPPFTGGTPETSEQGIVQRCLELTREKRMLREGAVREAAAKMVAM